MSPETRNRLACLRIVGRTAAAIVAVTLLAAPAALGQKSKKKPAPVRPAADGGLARRGRLGVMFTEAPDGLAVADVARNSPAAAAGLRAGDVISAVDGEKVTGRETLLARVRALRAGDSVALGILRDGSAIEVKLKADEVPREGDLDAKAEYSAFKGTHGLLRSIWSVPAKLGSGKHPAVLVVRGVAAPPADAAGSNPFRDLAFHLAHKGMLVVRYDAEGVGDSEGGPNAGVGFDAEFEDARAALAHLRADARVDPDRVVVLGQGTGGGIAARLAATDGHLAGLVVVGTVARPLMEYVLESRRAQLALAGAGASETDTYLRDHIAVFSRLADAGELAPDADGIVDASGNLLGKQPAFWREYDKADLAKVYASLDIPVMNAIGEYDFVSCLGEHRAIADALRPRAGSAQTLVVLDGADHDLRQFESREAAYAGFGDGSAPTSQRALDRISDWLRENVKGFGL